MGRTDGAPTLDEINKAHDDLCKAAAVADLMGAVAADELMDDTLSWASMLIVDLIEGAKRAVASRGLRGSRSNEGREHDASENDR